MKPTLQNFMNLLGQVDLTAMQTDPDRNFKSELFYSINIPNFMKLTILQI